jgi:hypothetical protein
MPQWNAELVTKNIRGQTGAVIQVTNILGVLIAGLVALAAKSNSSGHGVSEYTSLGWIIPTSLTGFFSAALIIPVTMIPESPVWILQKYESGEPNEKEMLLTRALDVLKKIRIWRGRGEELACLKEELQKTSAFNEGHSSRTLAQEIWHLLKNPGVDGDDDDLGILKVEAASIVYEIRCSRSPACGDFLKNGPTRLLHRTLVAIFIGGIGQNLAGMIALNNLSFQLFSEVGIDRPFLSTAVFDCVQLAGAVVGALYLDKGGRRHNLLWGSACLCCLILVVGGGLLSTRSLAMNDANFAFLLLYAFTFHATWASAWVYPSEISFPAERSKIAAFAMGAHFGGATVLVGVIALMLEWSAAGTMFFFAAGNLVSFVVVLLTSVETKHKTTPEIVADFQHLYNKDKDTESEDTDSCYVEMHEVDTQC